MGFPEMRINCSTWWILDMTGAVKQILHDSNKLSFTADC